MVSGQFGLHSFLISRLRSRMRLYVKKYTNLHKERNHGNVYRYMNMF